MNDDMLTAQPLFVEPPRRDRLTAISGAVQRRPIVLVLGMHRSGTSLCSHILSAIGVEMTDKIPGPGAASTTPDNPRGHWERWEIVEFHDRILGLFNRDYSGRFHDFPLPVAWWADPRVAQIRREMIGFLQTRMGDGYFGFKDPRTVRLMPVWHQILRELKLSPKVVFCLRNPAQVARSLHYRDRLDPEIGEYRWLVHIVDFFRYANAFDVCTVEYEGWFKEPNLEKLKQFLDLPWQQSELDLGLMLSGIIDPGARHDDYEYREASQPLVRSLYKLASHADHDTGARDQIACIVSQFVGFQQLQRPFQQAFEDVAKTAAKYLKIEQEAAALRVTIGGRDEAVGADARAAAVGGHLADALAELKQHRAQIADVARERDDRSASLNEAHAELASSRAAFAEIESVANALRARLADRETALTEASLRTEEQLAALQSARVELATQEKVLERAEQEGRERAAALAEALAEMASSRSALADMKNMANALRATLATCETAVLEAWRRGDEFLTALRSTEAELVTREAALQREITELRGALAQAAQEAKARGTAAEDARAEITTLRNAVARAERAAQEHRAAGEAMQAEIASVRNQLATAREVGRACLSSLQTDFRAVPEITTGAGWLTPIRRLIGFRTAGWLS